MGTGVPWGVERRAVGLWRWTLTFICHRCWDWVEPRLCFLSVPSWYVLGNCRS